MMLKAFEVPAGREGYGLLVNFLALKIDRFKMIFDSNSWKFTSLLCKTNWNPSSTVAALAGPICGTDVILEILHCTLVGSKPGSYMPNMAVLYFNKL